MDLENVKVNQTQINKDLVDMVKFSKEMMEKMTSSLKTLCRRRMKWKKHEENLLITT